MLLSFIVKFVQIYNVKRTKNKQKEAELGPIFYKKNNKEPVGGT